MAISPLGGLLAAILSLGSPAPTTATTPPAPPTSPTPVTSTAPATYTGTPPKAGQCRDMDEDDFDGDVDTRPAVSCSRYHTAYTFAVPTFPRGFDAAHLPYAQVKAEAAALCSQAVKPWAKGTRYQRFTSMWQMTVLTPSTADLAGGARWVSCSFGVQSKVLGMLPLPKHLRKPLVKNHAAVGKLCYLDTPVPCAQEHQYRAAAKPLKVHHKKPLTKKAFHRIARGCARVTHSKEWSALRPSAAAWKAGYRFLVCMRHTTH